MKVGVLYLDSSLSEIVPDDYQGRDADDTVLAVLHALKNLGHYAIPLGIRPESFQMLQEMELDLVFNLCDDGFYGHTWMEPHVAAMLDILRIRYTGSNHQTLTICLNKAYTKRILAHDGLPTAKFFVAKSADDIDHDLTYPLIVKPITEGGSIGIKNDAVVKNAKELKDRVARVIKNYNQPALVEEFINGREFNVALLGNEDPEVLPISEIEFHGLSEHERIVSYDAKWVTESKQYKGTVGRAPADIDEDLAEQLRDVAYEAYTLMGVSGYGRVDIRVDDEGPKILEINANPDVSVDAGLFRSAKAAGMNYEQLIDKILNFALERNI